MAIEFKSRKRVWIGELNIRSTIWNDAIHPMMKITQLCCIHDLQQCEMVQ
jgi:hypothetical protein